MKISFYGAAHEVTGSCSVIEAGGKTVMVDCGLEQGPDIYENCELPIAPSQIDFVILTHAHIDHSGKIPALTANGFTGKVYTTLATAKLCSIMLLDSAYIQESEAKWQARKAERSGETPYAPLYTVDDAQRALEQFVPCGYDTDIELCDSVSLRFTDAGHLLGSASASVTVREGGLERTVCFSGDLGNSRRPLIRDAQTPPPSDYVVIESTYGDRLHGERIDYVAQLSRIIQETLDRRGNLIIPSFAVGRTQELLYLIRIIKEKGLVRGHGDFPVVLDSPLAIEATEIYASNLRDYFDDETLSLLDRGINPIKFDNLRLSVTADDSVAINRDSTPKVIISASGMCEAGRIRHHLKHNLWRKECTVLFVGYQSEGTLGRIILDGAKRVRLFGEEVMVNARIERLEGISSHADRDMLVDWLRRIGKKPELCFVNHGSDNVCDEFAKTVESELMIRAEAPYNGAEYDLGTGICIDGGNTKRIPKRSYSSQEKNRRNLTVHGKLLTAARRLLAIAEGYRNAPNKDIARFTSQINSLCDRFKK